MKNLGLLKQRMKETLGNRASANLKLPFICNL